MSAQFYKASTYIFDVETGPLSRAELAEIVPTFEAPANWKDPEKIREYTQKKEVEWFQDAALSPITGRVLAIGFLDTLTQDVGYFASGDEAADLAAFWNQITNESGYLSHTLIGFNSNSFDIPFLMRRSWAKGVKVPEELVAGRYLPSHFVDLMDTWRAGNRQETISLDRLARFLGVGRKTGSGADFAGLWSMDQAAALEYLSNDLKLTYRCATRLLPHLFSL